MSKSDLQKRGMIEKMKEQAKTVEKQNLNESRPSKPSCLKSNKKLNDLINVMQEELTRC